MDIPQFEYGGTLTRQSSALGSLDLAGEYLRVRGFVLFPFYVLTMLPMTILMLQIIDAISSDHEAAMGRLCFWLIPATIWRWVGLAGMQQSVQKDLRGKQGMPLYRRIGDILLVRLFSNIGLTWGSLLIVPAFYGLFAGSFATPMLLERDGALEVEMKQLFSWIGLSAKRLRGVTYAITVLIVLMLIATVVVQYALLELILPSIAGIDTSSAAMVTGSWAWRLSVFYFVFCGFDFFWTVASVFIYFDSQYRTTGSDLAARLQMMSGGEA